MLQLYIAKPKRAELGERSKNLRVEVFMDAAKARFSSTIKPALLKTVADCDLPNPPETCSLTPGTQVRYDEANKLVVFRVGVDIDKRLRPKKDEEKAVGAKVAGVALVKAVRAFVARAGGLAPDVEVLGKPEGFKVTNEVMTRGNYLIEATLGLDETYKHALALQRRHDRLKAKAKKGGAKPTKAAPPAKKDAPAKGEAPAKADAPAKSAPAEKKGAPKK